MPTENLDQWFLAWFEASPAQGANRAGLWLKSRWTPGGTIKISFLDGDPALQARVAAVARQSELPHCPLQSPQIPHPNQQE